MLKKNQIKFDFKITLSDILMIVLIGVTLLSWCTNYSISKESLAIEMDKYRPKYSFAEYFPVKEITETIESVFYIENEGDKRGSFKAYISSNEFWLEGRDKGKKREVLYKYGIGRGNTSSLEFKIHMPTKKILPNLEFKTHMPTKKTLPNFASYQIKIVTTEEGLMYNKTYCYQLIDSRRYMNIDCPSS